MQEEVVISNSQDNELQQLGTRQPIQVRTELTQTLAF